MKFEIGKCYKHKKMQDVCIEIASIVGPNEFYVEWFNTSINKKMFLGEIVTISDDEFKNYYEFHYSDEYRGECGG